MPHLTIEYSQNIEVNQKFLPLLLKLHESISKIGDIKVENFKSRVYQAENYLIGSGNKREGFVHLDIRFLEGRDKEIKQKIGEQTCELLLLWFQPFSAALDLQVTVEVRDVQRSFYFKYPKGTLTPML